MDQLAGLLQGLQSSARAQMVLKTLMMVFDDVLSHPAEERHRRVKRDEITGIGAKLLESCGFVEDASTGELVLPGGADLHALREAREDVAHFLKKAELVADGAGATVARSVGPEAAPGPLVAASAAAMALQLAAASVSPTVTVPAPYANSWADDTLGAAIPDVSKARASGRGDANRAARTVPPSVATAAAAVGQAVASAGGPLALTGGGVLPSGLSSGPIGGLSKPGGRGGAGGSSKWTAAPYNTPPESRLVVELPDSEFTYIERPWSHFVTRWAAIDVELERCFGEVPFSLLDLGSCCGFFSLQAAAGYPQALVIGVEGSVGIGNGTTGVGGSEDQIIATKAVQTHLRWIEKLYLPNCLVTPDVWDYRRVCQLAALGRPISNAMLSLSVIHHIDSVSTQQYTAGRLGHLEGTLSLMAKLLELAPRHFIELPDRPWLEHVHSAYGTARAFLQAAAEASGRQWSFVGPLCVSEWYGLRELWLIEEIGADRSAIPWQGLKALFPRILGVSPQRALDTGATPVVSHSSGIAGAAAASANSAAAAAPPLPQQPPAHPAVVGAAPGAPHGERPQEAQHPPPQQPPLQVDGPLLQITPEELGAALLAAPTALIAAHVQLRDALAAADGMMQFARTLR